MSYKLRLIAAVALLCASAWSQRGALTSTRPLAELVDRSQVILRGHVVSAYAEPHPDYPNLQTIVVTVRSEKVLKGSTSASYTFRQYIWDYRDVLNRAGYRKGDEYLLMMNAPSEKGLTSPVGVLQGRFLVTRDTSGKQVAINGVGNQQLLSGVVESAKTRGAKLSASTLAVAVSPGQSTAGIPIDALEQMITSFVEAKQ